MTFRTLCAALLCAVTLGAFAEEGSQSEVSYRKLPASVYYDKMTGG